MALNHFCPMNPTLTGGCSCPGWPTVFGCCGFRPAGRGWWGCSCGCWCSGCSCCGCSGCCGGLVDRLNRFVVVLWVVGTWAVLWVFGPTAGCGWPTVMLPIETRSLNVLAICCFWLAIATRYFKVMSLGSFSKIGFSYLCLYEKATWRKRFRKSNFQNNTEPHTAREVFELSMVLKIILYFLEVKNW